MPTQKGVDICYEIHPGEDLHDGVTFERFLKATNNHSRAKILYDPSHFILQQLDYLQFIDFYKDYIKMFHVKDAEFNPTGKAGVYGGYLDWKDRPGRFRSPGDGQVDFKSIFSKLSQYGFEGWAVLEWECCIKSPEQGAKEGLNSLLIILLRSQKNLLTILQVPKLIKNKLKNTWFMRFLYHITFNNFFIACKGAII